MIEYNCLGSTLAWHSKSISGARRSFKTVLVFTFNVTLISTIGINNSFAQGQWQVAQDKLVNTPAGIETPVIETPVKDGVADIDDAAVGSLEAEALDKAEALKKAESPKKVAAAVEGATPIEGDAPVEDAPLVEDTQPVKLLAAKPRPPIPSLDPEVLRNLDQQFQKLRKTLETEDAFSAELGENYFSYGLLLKDVGRLDEAREMFLDALHLKKVNEGVYSMEQRPILKALFETHYAQGNSQAFEDNLSRIIWLEKKERSFDDDFSFDMSVQVGIYHINQFLYDPSARESSVAQLDKARRYLRYAVSRYGNAPISEKLMPYGELALISYLRKTIEFAPGRPNFFDQQSSQGRDQIRKQISRQRQELELSAASFNNGEQSLKLYLAKARQGKNNEHAVHALLGLGDINILFDRNFVAQQYYQLAWLEAQKLTEGHFLRDSFSRPVQLPAFNYAIERSPVERKKSSRYIPMTFKVDRLGNAHEIVGFSEGDANFEYFRKARRALRKVQFRPVISNGGIVSSELVKDDIRVFIKNKKPAELVENSAE